MNPQEIFERANNLSSFDGQVLSALGDGDDLLHFRGKGGNIASQGTDQFTYIIVNANASARVARLFTPISMNYPTAYPGQVVTGAFNDVNGAAGLTGSSASSAFSIESFLYYVSKNPSRLSHLRVKSTASSQLDYDLTLDEINPYRDITNSIFHPSNEINQDSQQTSIVIFPVDAQLSYLSDLVLSISGSSTATITFYMGTEVNTAKALEKKFDKAATIAAAMPEKVKQMNAANGYNRKRLG